MKFYYEVFETLDKESSAAGPWRLVYGTNGNNGLLKELKGNDSTKNMALDPTNFAAGTHPATLRDYWKTIEKDILAWSKDPGDIQLRIRIDTNGQFETSICRKLFPY